MRGFFAAAAVLWALLCGTLYADSPSIHGRVLDPAGLPLPGALVTMTGADTAPTSAVTDGAGEFDFRDVAPGRHAIRAELDGFEPSDRGDLDVRDETLTVDITLALATIHQEITVVAPSVPDVIDTSQPDAPVTVTRTVMDIAMLPNSQYDDVLALMPNVIRGPDGAISVAGARSTTGGLVVNGADERDPIFGGAGAMLPLEAVETLRVYPAGAPAGLGLASGGITSVQTRSGSDALRFRLGSFLPRLLFSDNALDGVEFWDPDLGISGPIVRGRSSFQQAVSYRYDRNAFTTLAGPDHNRFTALLSWTQVDTRVTDGQHLRFSVAFDPRSTDHSGVTAFSPSSSTPSVDQGGWSSNVSYAIAAGRVATELNAGVHHLKSDVSSSSDGTGSYVMSHDLVTGRYFDQQMRHAKQVSGGGQVTWSASRGHSLTAGASVERGALDEQTGGAPITLLYSDSSIARTVSFVRHDAVAADLTTFGMFVQDRWTAAPWLTVDLGVRRDVASDARLPRLQPRGGFTVNPRGGPTSISGSAGLFSDAVPLSALAFSTLPARLISAGSSAAEVTIPNAVETPLSAPAALRWNLQIDHHVGDWLLRVGYDERRGRDELIVHPGTSPADLSSSIVAPSVLESDGRSHARTFEATAGFRARSGEEAYASYVRSATYGSWNDVSMVEGLLRAPFVQADLDGPLPNDVPHRILAWGVFPLPSRVTIAPFLDTRSGFPFTGIDDGWVMVGTPGTFRLPWMTTLDLSATRVMRLPHHLPDARVGLKLYNLVNVNTERSVQRDIARTDFGARYDPVPRDFTFVFELLWGNRSSARSATRSNPR